MKQLFEYLISKENKKKIKFGKKSKLKEGYIISLHGGECYTVVNSSTLKSFKSGKYDNPEYTSKTPFVLVRLDVNDKTTLEYLDINDYNEDLEYIDQSYPLAKFKRITEIFPNKGRFEPKDIPHMIGGWYTARIWDTPKIKIENF